jgi:hypothetical protein
MSNNTVVMVEDDDLGRDYSVSPVHYLYSNHNKSVKEWYPYLIDGFFSHTPRSPRGAFLGNLLFSGLKDQHILQNRKHV